MLDMLVRKKVSEIESSPSKECLSRYSTSKKEIINFSAILFFGVMELIIVHIILINVNPNIALFVSALTIATLFFLGYVLLSLILKRTGVSQYGIHIDTAMSPKIFIPFSNISMIGTPGHGGTISKNQVFRATLMEEPNIEVCLKHPIYIKWLGRPRNALRIGICVSDVHQFTNLISSKILEISDLSAL